MLDVRNNFKQKYLKNKNISEDEVLACQLCKNHLDTEENILQCPVLKNDKDLKFEDLFSENMDQVSIVLKEFKKLWRKRQNILNQQQ